jgi:hypothetical protein
MGWRDEEARKILRRHEIAMSSLRPEGLRPEDWVDLDRMIGDLKVALGERGFRIRKSTFTRVPL